MSAAAVTDRADRAFLPWWMALLRECGPIELCDVHTHLGSNDPDGFSQTVEQLLAGLAEVDAQALVFPMHEPAGYEQANQRVIALAREHDQLEALARVDPTQELRTVLGEAERCLDAGARGFKLHPRAEGFALTERPVEGLFELAAERRAPILIHAGRGILALGRDALRLADAHPEARLILAHAAVSDLAWIRRRIEPGSNVFCDSAWWNPADLLALFAEVPSSQILWASDSPYGRPLGSALAHLRVAIEVGVDDDGLAAIAAGNARAVLAGEAVAPIGRPEPQPGAEDRDRDLDRIYTHLVSAFGASNAGGDPSEQVDLARLACQVEESPHDELCAAVERLLEQLAAELLPAERSKGHRFGELERYLVAAATVVRTPAAGCP